MIYAEFPKSSAVDSRNRISGGAPVETNSLFSLDRFLGGGILSQAVDRRIDSGPSPVQPVLRAFCPQAGSLCHYRFPTGTTP